MPHVTVFGGSLPKPGDEAYQQALHLGVLLGSAGYTVLTGGYIGTMEAVSRGAAENGGHVIGVTCEEIEAWRPVHANPWVQEEMRFKTLRQRLFALIEYCDAAVVMPGGIGTLAELGEMWSHLQTGGITPRPLILVGAGWRDVMEQFFKSFGGFVPDKYRQILSFAEDVDRAFAMLQSWDGAGKKQD
ncbi:MAG: LOG family protein [Anaerolineales bacterium]